MAFGENLRLLRKSKKMSQDELAEILGYKSFTTVQKWETGVSRPNKNIMVQIAKLFGVDFADLVADFPIITTSENRGVDWSDEFEANSYITSIYDPYLPLDYDLMGNYNFNKEGHENEGELLIIYPDGAREDISLAELDDIIDDALAHVSHRFRKIRRKRSHI